MVASPSFQALSRVFSVSAAGFTALLLCSVAGCRTAGKAEATATATPAAPATANPAGRYKVKAGTTSFFLLGPGQESGPDLALKRDTRLTVTRRGFGYSQVQLEDGTAGFVGTEDIVRLTPEEIVAESQPSSPLLAANPRGGIINLKPGAAGRRRPRPVGSNIPIAPPDEPGLPAAADPTPRTGPVPTFRY